MIELIYTSKAKQNLTVSDIEKIVNVSQKNNSDHDITGLLFFDNERFLQIIEGPEDFVKNLYEIIHKDNRHIDVTLLHHAKIKKRSFENWTMAYEALPHHAFKNADIINNALTPDEVLNITRDESKNFGAHLFGVFMGSTLTF